MKRVLLLVVLTVFVISTYAFAFSDIGDARVNSAVDDLVELGILNGYPDGTFKPDNTITRAEVSKIIVFTIGHENSHSDNLGAFNDLSESHWAYNYIYTMKDMGIINGTSATTFEPESNITYEQAIKMVVAALGYDTEAKSRGGYPDGYISMADELNILSGISYAKNDSATRGDIALMIRNALDVTFYFLYPGEYGIERDRSEKTLYELHCELLEMDELDSDSDYYDDELSSDDFEYEYDEDDVGSVG